LWSWDGEGLAWTGNWPSQGLQERLSRRAGFDVREVLAEGRERA